MIAIAVGSAIFLVAVQAAVNVPRTAFSTCLNQAAAKARTEKVEVAAFPEYLRTACAAEATKFRDALISFDVKNGIARKTATSDADLQVDDYIDAATNTYRRHFRAAPERG